MQPFEAAYVDLVESVLRDGEFRSTRNAQTLSTFGKSLSFDLADGFPILQGRKIYYKGVFGELAALLRKPTCVADFERWGCNYWKSWGDQEGNLTLDYGNAWFDFNGADQIAELKRMLRHDPTNRRMIISSWRPDRLKQLSLPCCHYSYQFYVRDGNTLDMIWTQRSVDVAVGLPSDAVFAAAWLIAIADEFGFLAGRCKMDFGDTHIYADHQTQIEKYLAAAYTHESNPVVWCHEGTGDFCEFIPSSLTLIGYNPAAPLVFTLHR